MTLHPSHLDAHDEPPAVHGIDGEVLLTGPHVDAVYTVRAARALAGRILTVVDRLEKTAGQSDGV